MNSCEFAFKASRTFCPICRVGSTLAGVGGPDTAVGPRIESAGTGANGEGERDGRVQQAHKQGPWGLSWRLERGERGGKGTFQGRTAASEGGRLRQSLTISRSYTPFPSPLARTLVAGLTPSRYDKLCRFRPRTRSESCCGLVGGNGFFFFFIFGAHAVASFDDRESACGRLV